MVKTCVRLEFTDGSKRFVENAHVYGMRDGAIMLAAGSTIRSDVDTQILSAVPIATLLCAVTVEEVFDGDVGDGPEWVISW